MKRTWQLAVHATSLHAVSVTWLRNTGVGTVVTLVSLARSFFLFFFSFFLTRPEMKRPKSTEGDDREWKNRFSCSMAAFTKNKRDFTKKTRVSRVGMQAAINIVLRELF